MVDVWFVIFSGFGGGGGKLFFVYIVRDCVGLWFLVDYFYSLGKY